MDIPAVAEKPLVSKIPSNLLLEIKSTKKKLKRFYPARKLSKSLFGKYEKMPSSQIFAIKNCKLKKTKHLINIHRPKIYKIRHPVLYELQLKFEKLI